ncbi:MAG TPA: hypothetical protein VI685_12620 [Candidatus Angelobacter sp.]
MPNNKDNRVLGRRNARVLSAEEFDKLLPKGNTVITLHMTSVIQPDE